MRAAMLGHECLWRRCTCRDCGDPMRNRAHARKLRRARKHHEHAAWRRELKEDPCT